MFDRRTRDPEMPTEASGGFVARSTPEVDPNLSHRFMQRDSSWASTMSEPLTLLSLVVAAFFTGAAVYVNAVEHPARRHLDPPAALKEWQPAYKRGAAMQSTSALVGFVLAAAAAWRGAGPFVALGAALIIAPWPWTYLAIMPLNRRLLALTPGEAGSDVHSMLDRWDALHRVRTLLGAAATASLFLASLLS
jgi:hypothetical protein